jgi:rare lipoprotein A
MQDNKGMHMLCRNSGRLLSGVVCIALGAFVTNAQAEPAETTGKPLQRGVASWYGPGFHGKKTASGERFNTHDMTAAHRTLPFGTKVRVVNRRTGKAVVVRINDRGPYAHGRVIDLSKASAQALGITGVGAVELAQL